MTTELDVSIDLSNVATVPPVGLSEQTRIFLREIEEGSGEYLLVIDNTASEKIVRCPTAGRFYVVEAREGYAKNAALVFGGSIHDGIELMLKGKSNEEQNNAIAKYWQENPPPPDEYRTLNNALSVMSHYRIAQSVRADYQWTILEDDAGPIIERPFELPLGVLEINANIRLPKWESARFVRNIHVAWSGRIDLIAFCNAMNRVVDHKTTSMGGDQFVQSFQLSNQTIGYCWAAQQMWPSLFPRDYVTGFALDAIFFKKPTGNVGLTDKGPRGGEPACQFFRNYFEYGQERVDQWAANALTIVEDFVHSIVRNNFPMYTAHCFNKFGRCPYYDVCTIDNTETRLRFLNSDAFKDVTWDPTQGR
jgi:hypothetical protein